MAANSRFAQPGFSLIECMVALAVFSIAVLALLNAQGESLRSSAGIEDRAFAQIVAENRMVEIMALPETPALGLASGEEWAGARPWTWSQRVSRTPQSDIRRIEVAVHGTKSEQVLASVVAFRGVR